MASYPPDPGGNFASDAHRRVMAHLPNPDDEALSIADLITARINADPHALAHFSDAAEVADILEELEADGHAKQLKSGWRNTAEGFALLTGPPEETDAATAPATMGLDPASLNGGES